MGRRVMNGGAWLEVEGRSVVLHYRDLDDVELRWREARPEYPEALRRSTARRWHAGALHSLHYATHTADAVITAGNLSRAAVKEAHARLAAAGIWVTNEKGITRRAGIAWQPDDGVAALRAELAGATE